MKKIIRSLFVLILGAFLINALNVKAETPLIELIEGASIRTQGVQGLRFYAKIDESIKENEHGFYLVYGETTVEDLQIALGQATTIINSKEVFKVVVPGVTAKNEFSVVLIGIPEEGYLDKLTAIPYVVVNGETQLALTLITRSIGEVALKMEVEDGGAPVGILNSMKKVTINAFGKLEITGNLYETNHFNLREEFRNDWNLKFVAANLVDFDATTFYNSAKEGSLDDVGSNYNLALTNIYQFFNDPVFGAKWGWLLNFIESVDGTTHTTRQIVAIKGDGTNGTEKLYNANHLSYSLANFFNQEHKVGGYSAIDFTTLSFYNNLMNFNNKVYINPADYEFYLVGSEITIPEAPAEVGYDFIHYKAGELEVVPGQTAIILETDVTFELIYHAINYNVNFFDGAIPIGTETTTYNIENELILPALERPGYVFDGWFDNVELTGEPITSIPLGSTGDKVYYLKMTEILNVPVEVTYKLNRGMLDPFQMVEYRDSVHIEATRYFDKGDSTGNPITVGPGSGGLYWHVMAFKDTVVPGVYEFIGKGTGYTNEHATIYISYHDAIDSPYKAAIQAKYGNIVAGELVVIPVLPPGFSTLTSVDMYFMAADAFVSDVNKSLILPTNLFIPFRFATGFLGWYDNPSFTGEPIFEFPGYLVEDNITAITYYAKWEVNEAMVLYDLGEYGYISTLTKLDIFVDFATDYKEFYGRTATSIEDLIASFAAKSYISGNIEDIFEPTYQEGKWSWLAYYIFDTANETNYADLTKLANWDQTTWRTNLEAFFNDKQFNYAGACESIDFSIEEAANSFWRYTPYNKAAQELSTAVLIDGSKTQTWKTEVLFAGWYNNSDFTGAAVTTLPVTSEVDIILYAKWELDLTLVHYDLGEYGYISDITKDDIFRDFATDYKELYGRTAVTVQQIVDDFTANTYLPNDNIKDIFLATYKDGKWTELGDYIYQVALATNYAHLDKLQEHNQTYWRVNIEAFFNNKEFTYIGANAVEYQSANFSTEEAAYGFWKDSPYNKVTLELPTAHLIDSSEIQVWKTGYVFDGWYTNAQFTGDAVIALPETSEVDIMLYAKWRQIVPVTVSFNLGYEGAAALPDIIVDQGTAVLEPVDPERSGHVFLGWHLGENLYNFTTPVTTNITLVAQWRLLEEYTVTFKLDINDLNPTIIDVLENNKVQKPDTPIKAGDYLFANWLLNGIEFDFNTPITESVILVASWTETAAVTITFDLNYVGAEAISDVKIAKGTKVAEPAEPIRDLHIFLGWFVPLAIEAYDFNLAVDTNLALEARWLLIETYTIAYELNGGNFLGDYANKTAMIDAFLDDFYTYLGLTSNIVEFKHGVGNTEGFAGTWYSLHKANLYAGPRPVEVNEAYFASSATYMEKWLPFFDNAHDFVVAVNGTQFFWGPGTSTGLLRLYQYITNDPDRAPFLQMLPKEYFPPKEYQNISLDIELVAPVKDGFIFLGWYNNAGFTGDPIVVIKETDTDNVTLYAKWGV